MKEFSCGAVVPGCDMKFEADSEGAILEQVAQHASQDHGITEVTPELVEQVKAHIHDSE
jgi:predicted small metal-binding protein